MAPPVAARYDALLFDLDGVVYRGDEPVPGAAEAIRALQDLGLPLLFLTNNSSRTPEEVAAKLGGLGVAAEPAEIVTSGMATAAMLQRTGWAGRKAFVIGENGVRAALAGAGIEVVDGEPSRADLVVVGWDRSADYAKLRIASLLVQRGAALVATNADSAYPAPDGLWPGAGALLAAVTTTTGARATVVGKPAAPMFEESARIAGATHPLVVGDRLDTDVAGAAGMGWDSVLSLTGAATLGDLPGAPVLPTFVVRDLGFLLRDVPPGRFVPASPAMADSTAGLLEASGLSAQGLHERLGTTFVCLASGTQGEVAATFALEPAGPDAILRSVAVRADLRGSGLGALATATAIRMAREQGRSRVALFTEGAAGFFELLGFRRVEREDLPAAVRDSDHAVGCADTAEAMVADVPQGG